MKTDFHMHSCHSDGVLTGVELLNLARERSIQQISITDHDSLAVYDELRDQMPIDIQLLPGCEFSSLWRSMCVHIVGLNLNLQSASLQNALIIQARARVTRSESIAAILEKKGFSGALERVQEIAGNAVIGRPHFAEFLVEEGYVKDRKQAFKKYLGAGKPGDVKAQWRSLEEVCQWILEAGGVPVLAHPLKYGLTQTKLKTLLVEFKDAGGQAIEVISGAQDAGRTAQAAHLAEQFGFHGSLGSDFHQPGQSWADLGFIPELPQNCHPVWELWS